MKKITSAGLLLLSLFFGIKFMSPRASAQNTEPTRAAEIKNIQVFGADSGIAYTRDAIFRTDDNGAAWREISLPREFTSSLSAVFFRDANSGWAILNDGQSLQMARTTDGGTNWRTHALNLSAEKLSDADLENPVAFVVAGNRMQITLRTATSSNFTGIIYGASGDAGETWQISKSSTEIKIVDAPQETSSGNWKLITGGNCADGKTGCAGETKIFDGARDITPPQIREIAESEQAAAKLQAQNSVFAAPFAAGSTRISLNRGFDKCTAATAAQMQTWWNNSPFYDANIYISGRNRGCSQPQLSAAWVNQVSAQGWGLIPTVVGYQASCSVCASCQKHSSDPAAAETQGRGEADIAVTDANNLGLLQGTVLYYDMERYDDTSGTGACSTPVKAFLKGWTDRLKERGYISGVYGSPTNAAGDWINIPPASQPDVVWLARWNNVMSVWGVAPLTDSFWTNHQRIHQWVGPRDETWGGVTFNIDNNIADAPVAGAPIPRNKTADFDGDGKTDISVWRPSDGGWYIFNSQTATYRISQFGVSTDIFAPGDYDGDGKTDLAVFRPSEGYWYFYSRSIYRAFPFGQNGDIPAPADYDGDGKTDLGIFRSGEWYLQQTRDGILITQLGGGSDKPVPGGYLPQN